METLKLIQFLEGQIKGDERNLDTKVLKLKELERRINVDRISLLRKEDRLRSLKLSEVRRNMNIAYSWYKWNE